MDSEKKSYEDGHVDGDVFIFDLCKLEDEPSTSLDSVTSNLSVEESPLLVPSYNMDGGSISISSNSANLMILDRSPSSTPNTSIDFNEEHGFMDAAPIDIRTMVSFKDPDPEPDLKAVKFLAAPEEVVYVVSVDVVQDSLRVPAKLHKPLRLQQSTTALQQIGSSEMLQSAASNALVRVEPADDIKNDDDGDIDHDDDDGRARPFSMQLIRLYLEQDMFGPVRFDKISVTESNRKTVLLGSKGLTAGKHEWNLKIERTDVDLAEIGVVSVGDIDAIPVADGGVFETNAFGARAVYGNEKSSDALFYCSFDADGHQRCRRDLRPHFKTGWTVGDVVTVRLDLSKWRIKYLLNGKAVRFTMSLETNKVYFPIICFSGNCKYSLN